MPELFSWYLSEHGPAVIAHGVVSGHRKMPEGERVHTSAILRMVESEGRVLMETASGSLYDLRMEEHCGLDGRITLPLPSPDKLGLTPDFWERCARARIEADRAEKRLSLPPGTLRLRIVGATVAAARWYGPDGDSWSMPPGHTHAGMFQDSVLLQSAYTRGGESGHVDFRYFPYINRMETYKVSDEIKTIQIVNLGLQDVAFDHRGRRISCAAGAVTNIDAGN